jgi:hypothetical protein
MSTRTLVEVVCTIGFNVSVPDVAAGDVTVEGERTTVSMTLVMTAVALIATGVE